MSARFELLCKIASGGAASVYVARLVGGRDLVAVKRPHPHLLDAPGFRDSFLAEARVASRIRHPNVVSVREVATEGESVLLVMDYVEGASLAELVRFGAAPVPVALRVLLDACAGLEAAHALAGEDGRSLDVVHRDVSPHNLLVGVDGVCRITDFGIAKCLAENTAETTQGIVKGKVAYMSPEQLRGERLDRRTDVFALGVVSWELLTGERLFRRTTDAESIARVLSEVPRPPSEIVPGLPRALDAVIARALAKASTDRPASARELGTTMAAAGAEIGDRAAVAAWVQERAREEIARRRSEIALADAREPTADVAVTRTAPVRRGVRLSWPLVVAGIAAAAGVLAVLNGRPSETQAPLPSAMPPPVVESVPAASGAAISATASASSAPASRAPLPSRRPRRSAPARTTPSTTGTGRFTAPPNPYE